MKHLQAIPLRRARALLSMAALCAASAGAETGSIEEIVVVGSRIQKPDYTFSNPVQSVDAEAIRFSGTTDLADFLKEYPALVGSLDANDAAGSNAFIGGTGLTLLNLRNLGEERTLVLVDGRRHVASLPGTSAVDIDTIPIDLIERVEILTGGASAIYGADGVSGVVNFVMKHDFEGVNVSARTGQSSQSDAQNYLVSGTAGTDLFDGRGHGTLAVEWSRDERLKANDRDYAGGGGRYAFVTNPFADTPNEIPLQNIRFFDSSPAGAVDTNFDFVQDFNGTDTPWDGGTIPYIPPYYQQGGDGSRQDQFIGDLLPQQERLTFNGIFDYELSPKARFFSELKLSQNESFSQSQPTFDFYLLLEPDYAYYPPNIAAALAAANPEEVPGALVSRDNFDLGVRGEKVERETLRGVFGFEGDLTDNLSYEVSYVYGETDVTTHSENNRYNDRFAAALDAVVDESTGAIVCRSTLDPSYAPANLDWQGWGANYTPRPGTWAGSFTPGPQSGCVPLNIIGNNVASRAAHDWVMFTSEDDASIEQQVAQAYLTGDSEPWFSLPAGPIGFAAGVEWRKEKSSSEPAAADRAGLTFGNIVEPVKGDYDVREAFVEIDVPLLSDLPGVQELTFDAAGRLSDYSTIGNAETWKLGLAWQPIDDILVRGTLAEATRAPNIGELFDPGGQTFEFITDPCDENQLQNGTVYRAANCAQILTALGVDPNGYVDPNSASIPGTLAGNPDLTEEVVDTRTVGIVLRPRFAPDLTISVDWYDIDLEDAINTATPEETAQICVDLPTIDNNFCGLLQREDGTGAIVDYLSQPLNVAEFTTEGYDFTVDYLVDPTDWGVKRDVGVFNLRVVGNHLTDLTFVNLPGAIPDEDKGEEDAPEWQYKLDLTWRYEALLINYGFSWFDETRRYTREVTQANPDIAARRYWDYNERRVHDLHVSYDYREGATLYAGVNNVTDEEPDLGRVFYPVSAVGRFFYFGVDVQLDVFR